jgi:hypothetical protein
MTIRTTEAWESGIHHMGPPRYQTLWHPLTRLDHPERLWELRMLKSSPPQPVERPDAQIEIGAAELFELVGGFLRFVIAAILAQAKDRLSTKSCQGVWSDRT